MFTVRPPAQPISSPGLPTIQDVQDTPDRPGNRRQWGNPYDAKTALLSSPVVDPAF